MMALLLQKAALARSGVAMIAKSESTRCYACLSNIGVDKLCAEPNLKSNDNAQARDLPVTRQSLNLKTIAQKPLHQNKSRVVPQHGVSVKRNSVRKSENKNVPKPQTGERDVQKGEKQTVCRTKVIVNATS